MDFSLVNSWDFYIDNFFSPASSDIYFREEYVKLYCIEKDLYPRCCVVREKNNICLFPFIVRRFIFDGKVYYDFETAYGYGGPIYNSTDIKFINEAQILITEQLKKLGFVAGFVRFHPIFENYKDFILGPVLDDRETIGVNLNISEQEIWSEEISSKNRNMIRKAKKSNLQVEIDYKMEKINDFMQIYNETMNKLDANSFYFFPNNYYLNFRDTIKNSMLVFVRKDDTLASGAIFMWSGCIGHYHLSGSKTDLLKYAPNNLMIYCAAMELKKQGVKVLHLGGGTTSLDNDPLLKFKQRFGSLRFKFKIGKIIFNNELYQELCSIWEKHNPDKLLKYGNYFLKYKY